MNMESVLIQGVVCRFQQYLALCKLRVISLIVFTAVIGMFLAVPGWPAWNVLWAGTLGIALVAAAAAAFNCLVEQKIDAKMARTRARPLPRMRRSGRPVPDPVFRTFEAVDLAEVDAILDEYDHDPQQMLAILEATQAAYGYLPVAAIKRISHATGAWYATIYGTATFYAHLRFEPATATDQAAAMARQRPPEAAYLAALDAALVGHGAPGTAARA